MDFFEKKYIPALIRGAFIKAGFQIAVTAASDSCEADVQVAGDSPEAIKEGLAAVVSKLDVKKAAVTVEVSGTVYKVSELDGSAGTPVAGRIALVTGGAQGFGEGLVRNFAEAGSFVYIADMNIGGAQKLAEELNSEAGRDIAAAVEVNVTDEDSVAAMVDFVLEKTGGLDILINNAGVLKAGSVKEIALRDFKFVTDVNYIGYFICVKFVSRMMSVQNFASESDYLDIIQINSKSGLEGSNKNGAYAGGKFGGIGLTQSFALELVEDRIKVNSICPGNFFDGPLWSDPERGLFVQYLRTGKVPGAQSIADVKAFYEAKVPMKRGCGSEDVFKAVKYIVDQKYETGQAVPVTGGQVMLN